MLLFLRGSSWQGEVCAAFVAVRPASTGSSITGTAVFVAGKAAGIARAARKGAPRRAFCHEVLVGSRSRAFGGGLGRSCSTTSADGGNPVQCLDEIKDRVGASGRSKSA